MTITRAQIDALINRRCGALLRECGMALTEGGDNPDLSDPIAWALRQCGISTADPIAPTEAEIAGVGTSALDKFFDHTELRALESALTRYVGVDASAQGEGRQASQLGARLEKAISRKRDQIARDYGTTASTLTAGVIGLAFQETFADA
jgi:hypothetical protein